MTPVMHTITSHSAAHGPIELNVAVAGEPDAPLILCVHGWPEQWRSWSGQMSFFADRGYRVAAMDVRGYGGSSRPEAIEAYRLLELVGDVIAVADALSPDERVVLFGHDWGSPTVHHAARLHADRVRGVVGMSVPYIPATPGNPMELWDAVYADRFFYMKYFQEPGVAEAAFEADLTTALRKCYHAASGDAPREVWFTDRPADAAFLDILVEPETEPAWMPADRLRQAVEANAGGPTHGWFHRYRAQYLDGDDLSAIGEPMIDVPAGFIGGTRDIVRHFVPGLDLFDTAAAGYAHPVGVTLIEGAGHWVQQERPDETNAALATFVEAF